MPFNSHITASRWLRLCLALLVAAFVLGTLAHAGHVHASKDQVAHHSVCDYCVGFAHLGAAPTHAVALLVTALRDEAPSTPVISIPSVATHTVAQPRAPPR